MEKAVNGLMKSSSAVEAANELILNTLLQSVERVDLRLWELVDAVEENV